MRSALLIAIYLILAPAWALAKPRVALVTFEGDPGGEAQDVVTEIIGDDVMLVGPKQVNRTVDKLGLDTASLADRDLRKLSKELSADAVVQAKLSKSGDHKLLHFKVFLHGKKQKGFKVEFASLKSKVFRQQLHDKMIEKLDAENKGDTTVAATKPTHDDDDEDPLNGGQQGKKARNAKKVATSDDDPLATMKTKKGAKSDDDADARTTKKEPKADPDAGPKEVDKEAPKSDESKGDDDDEAPRHSKHAVARAGGDDDGEVAAHAEVERRGGGGHAANRDAFRVDLGGSVQKRSLSFTSRNFPQAPANYSPKPTGGARLGLELYPLAFSSESIGAGLGIAGLYDQTIGLSLQFPAQPGTKFAVTERHYEVGPRFRMVFGHTPTSPSATLGVSYMNRTFTINRTALGAGNTIDIPDVVYKGFDPTLEFRVPLLERVAVILGGELILLNSAGPIQNLTSYGQAKITGGSGVLGFDIQIARHIAFDVRGEVTQIGYAFTGNGAMANNRDGDPTSKDVGGAADRYIGGVATLAVLY
ncbi:hypothetical protein BH11MYX1_BH11MYX1_47470 [soil metagenome]